MEKEKRNYEAEKRLVLSDDSLNDLSELMRLYCAVTDTKVGYLEDCNEGVLIQCGGCKQCAEKIKPLYFIVVEYCDEVFNVKKGMWPCYFIKWEEDYYMIERQCSKTILSNVDLSCYDESIREEKKKSFIDLKAIQEYYIGSMIDKKFIYKND